MSNNQDLFQNQKEPITTDEAKAAGIDMSMVSACETLRKLAKIGRLTLDESEHRDNSRNLHLFQYIEYCGMKPLDYFKEYLSNLQPYMLTRFQNQEKADSFICVLDNLYQVPIYIKTDKAVGQEIIVSFHDGTKDDIAIKSYRPNGLRANLSRFSQQEYVPIIAEEVEGAVPNTNKYDVKFFVQCRMTAMPIVLLGYECQNGTFLVRRASIEDRILDICYEHLNDLVYRNLVEHPETDKPVVDKLTSVQQLTFTFYARDPASNLSLLIDTLDKTTFAQARKTTDFVIISYIQGLKLTESQKSELQQVLTERYKSSSIEHISNILERITMALENSVIA